MSVNLDLNPELLAHALRVSGEDTMRAAVTKALEEFVARREGKGLLDLMGKLEADACYDYKADRSRD